jgi:signal transduction histidine kinase
LTRLLRLLRTSAVRLAIRYALLYAVLIALGLGVLYWSTARFVDAQLGAGLRKSLDELGKARAALDPAAFSALIRTRLRAHTHDGLHFLLVDRDGRPIAGDFTGWPSGLPSDGQVHNVHIEDALIPGRAENQDSYWPAVGRRFANGSRLLVAQGLDQAEELLDFVQGTMAAILGISVALALGLGLLQGRTLLLRIDGLIDTARAIGAGRLQRRVPISGRNDEFDELAGQLNAMLGRIEELMAGLRQVTDNVAHDLRSPLSRVRNLLDVTLLEGRDAGEYRAAIERATAGIDEVIRTFNALLEIAQTEAGSFRGEWGLVDLSALAQELGELYRDTAEEQGKLLELDLSPDLKVTGNRHLLAQALSNLLDNAVKFTPAGQSIRLSAFREASQVCLQISDRGPGIPSAERARVLQRFVRLDAARSTPGSGLGLSLVAAVARLHGATLRLEDAGPGLIVRLAFPRGPNA